MTGRPSQLYGRGTSDGEPRFLSPQFERRCPDCDYNGYLQADGRKNGRLRHMIRRCETCGGFGRLRLITRDRLRAEPELAAYVSEPGWLFVSRKETLDQYMLDVPAKGAGRASDGTVGAG